jgi:hypothetical protein
MDYLEEAYTRLRLEAAELFNSFDKEELRINAPEWKYDIDHSWRWPELMREMAGAILREKSDIFRQGFFAAFRAEYDKFIRALPLSDRRRMADHWARKEGLINGMKFTTGEELIEYNLNTMFRSQGCSDQRIKLARSDMIRAYFYSNDPSELVATAL